MKRLRYIFPATTDFRETRPTLCWEHMYGWIDGYGLLFDPVILSRTRVIPEWENGWNGVAARDDFLIACCHQASEVIGRPRHAGLYIRPAQGPAIIERGRLSEKERLRTPRGDFFYSYRLPFDRYSGSGGAWQIGENPALARLEAGALAVGFEFFALVTAWNGDWPQRRLLEGGLLLHDLLGEAGALAPRRLPSVAPGLTDLRLDFQAYGVNRLMLQWLLEKCGASRGLVAPADQECLRAASAWSGGKLATARTALKAAFAALCEVRRQYSQLELHFMEFPHLGILLPNKGFFELEWPEYSRATMESYIDHIRRHNYRVSLEAGGSCWENLTRRFPALGEDLKKLWRSGKVELTNGTQSLPFALQSPLALQYWQLRVGSESFRRVFGQVPKTYQCQENSFSPQMPELLLHFGYPRALHITQNRGQTPGEETDFIWWQSPAGHRLPAMTTRHPTLGRKGCNYFHDLPLIHAEYGRAAQSLNYVNFMDLGYVPYRVHMIRAHRYAPVWGSFGLAAPRFADGFDPASAPARTYSADAYKMSQNAFYPDETNVDALSQHEYAYGLAHHLRQLQVSAFVAGRWPRQRRALEALWPSLLLLEAHDFIICQGQRVGEFHAPNTTITPPYFRDTLVAEGRKIAEEIRGKLREIQSGMDTGRTARLFNAAEVELPFARVTGAATGARGLVPCGMHTIAVGPFMPFSAAAPAPLPSGWSPAKLPLTAGVWRLAMDAGGRVLLRHGDRRIPVAPTDSRHGAFVPVRATGSRCGPLLRLEVLYRTDTAGFQQVAQVTVLTARDSAMAEIEVSYTPGRAFDVRDRWADRLSLRFETGGPIRTIRRFNPNVYAETAEDRISSPYCISAEAASGRLVLLNEGAFHYEADRAAGRLDWLFHVADESIHSRRMALLMDDSVDPFLHSRAWSQGVTPLARVAHPWPKVAGGWKQLSAETLVDDRVLLVSNLAGEARTFSVSDRQVKRAVDVEGRSRLRRDTGGRLRLELQPYELAFLHLASGRTYEHT